MEELIFGLILFAFAVLGCMVVAMYILLSKALKMFFDEAERIEKGVLTHVE